MNQGNTVGQTALHIAALWCNARSVQFLLSVGANPNQANQMGFCPLHTLLLHNKKSCREQLVIAKLLIDGGADLAAKTGQDMVPWEYLARHLEEQGIDDEEAAKDLMAMLKP